MIHLEAYGVADFASALRGRAAEGMAVEADNIPDLVHAGDWEIE